MYKTDKDYINARLARVNENTGLKFVLKDKAIVLNASPVSSVEFFAGTAWELKSYVKGFEDGAVRVAEEQKRLMKSYAKPKKQKKDVKPVEKASKPKTEKRKAGRPRKTTATAKNAPSHAELDKRLAWIEKRDAARKASLVKVVPQYNDHDEALKRFSRIRRRNLGTALDIATTRTQKLSKEEQAYLAFLGKQRFTAAKTVVPKMDKSAVRTAQDKLIVNGFVGSVISKDSGKSETKHFLTELGIVGYYLQEKVEPMLADKTVVVAKTSPAKTVRSGKNVTKKVVIVDSLGTKNSSPKSNTKPTKKPVAKASKATKTVAKKTSKASKKPVADKATKKTDANKAPKKTVARKAERSNKIPVENKSAVVALVKKVLGKSDKAKTSTVAKKQVKTVKATSKPGTSAKQIKSNKKANVKGAKKVESKKVKPLAKVGKNKK